MTGIVNFYLGYRLLNENSQMKSNIAFIALLNYGTCIVINWAYQIYIIGKYIFSDFPLFGLYVYLILIYFIVKDDLILISVLIYKSDLTKRLKPIYLKFKRSTVSTIENEVTHIDIPLT